MPSKNKNYKKSRKTLAKTKGLSRSKVSTPAAPKRQANVGFFPLLTLILILWVLYRQLFTFPVWFDESVGKAMFFGLPVWIYVMMTRSKSIVDTFAPYKLRQGLLLGLAFGGIFGFVSSFIAVMQKGGVVSEVWLFTADAFWIEFMLAVMTAFWETLLFYSFTMTIIQEKFPRWGLFSQTLLVALIFLVFHIPNTLIRFSAAEVASQLMLMFMFGLGQAYLFESKKNAYALVLSHAIWGMVLLTHFW